VIDTSRTFRAQTCVHLYHCGQLSKGEIWTCKAPRHSQCVTEDSANTSRSGAAIQQVLQAARKAAVGAQTIRGYWSGATRRQCLRNRNGA